MRRYPEIDDQHKLEPPPITFVTVRFSSDFEHNLQTSLACLDRRHQSVVIDNSQGLSFATLGEALDLGLQQAQHDLVAFVHEDVMLPVGFYGRLARSLYVLETRDPQWGLLGVAGWDRSGRLTGHWSDPHRYRNTLSYRIVAPVTRIDEQFMVIRKSGDIRPDPHLPSIHGIGWDLALQARTLHRATYVIDAPTIHKFADENGERIEHAIDSSKIRHRQTLTFEADRTVADEYLQHKWRLGSAHPSARRSSQPPEDPIILLGRGGSGTRLLGAMARGLGIFIGSERNFSDDSLEMAPAIYRALLRTYVRNYDSSARSALDLADAARDMLDLACPPGAWGFKVPESMLVVPPLAEAFPKARFLHLVRDPLSTCLRRPHMTARPDNEIGRACLRAAYRHANLPGSRSASDSNCVRMAHTTTHQLDAVLDMRDEGHLDTRYFELRFEDLIATPESTMDRAAKWLGLKVEQPGLLSATVDPHRAEPRTSDISASDLRQVAEITRRVRKRLGYGGEP